MPNFHSRKAKPLQAAEVGEKDVAARGSDQACGTAKVEEERRVDTL